jgi:hypothetical protein
MRWFALVLLVGCAGEASDLETAEDTDEADTDAGDTDTDIGPDDEPQFAIVGEYTLGHGELLPEDAAVYEEFGDWGASLSAEDFPEYEPCMGEVVNVDQGFVFVDGGELVRRYDLEARTCSGDGLTEDHTIYVDYGTWSFAGNADPDSGDLYTVNDSRTWRIYPLNDYFAVREGEVRFSLAPID